MGIGCTNSRGPLPGLSYFHVQAVSITEAGGAGKQSVLSVLIPITPLASFKTYAYCLSGSSTPHQRLLRHCKCPDTAASASPHRHTHTPDQTGSLKCSTPWARQSGMTLDTQQNNVLCESSDVYSTQNMWMLRHTRVEPVLAKVPLPLTPCQVSQHGQIKGSAASENPSPDQTPHYGSNR